MAIALAVILVGLLGRAAIDKILALRAGPEAVALWAQLQSLVELVAGVTMAGVGQGLTVLVAQAPAHRAPHHLLRAALVAGLAVSGLATLAIVLGPAPLSLRFTAGEVAPALIAFAAAAGCCALAPGLLSAYWLGTGRRDRILMLNLASMLAMVGAAYFALPGKIAHSVLAAQAASALLAGAALIFWLRSVPAGAQSGANADVRRLLRYVPVGLSIGVLGPLSALFVRGTLSDALSWGDAGVVQGLWRASEWITHLAGGLLWLVFLPRFSAACHSARFARELSRAALALFAVSAVLLLLLWANQRQVLAALYDARFAMPDRAAALFLLGDWLRIGSWVFLHALFAMQRTTPIALGELLSIPLFAALLVLFADGLSLERAGLLYCAAYAIYLTFNAAVVLRAVRRIAA